MAKKKPTKKMAAMPPMAAKKPGMPKGKKRGGMGDLAMLKKKML